jgi:hypothetical protein
VFAELATRLAPSGATLEEAAARRAISDALFSLYERYDLENADLSRLDAMDGDAIRDALQVSVASYIYHRWLQELGDRIEENAIDADQAYRLEREVRDYVQLAVRLDLANVDVMNMDWDGQEGRQLMDRIYNEAYSLLENQ